MKSSDLFVVILCLVCSWGYWLYQKLSNRKGKGKRGIVQVKKDKKRHAPAYMQNRMIHSQQPEITLTIMPNQHKKIVINYDVHQQVQTSENPSSERRTLLWVSSLSIILGIGFGYLFYRLLI